MLGQHLVKRAHACRSRHAADFAEYSSAWRTPHNLHLNQRRLGPHDPVARPRPLAAHVAGDDRGFHGCQNRPGERCRQ